MKAKKWGRALEVWMLAGVFGLCSILGCGQASPSSLKGQVTLDKKPVQDGNLVLRPMQGTRGSPVATKISGGTYEIPQDQGLKAGTYLVLITATDKEGQYIPDKYNIASRETVDLAAGVNEKDFALEPGQVTAAPMMKGEEAPSPTPK